MGGHSSSSGLDVGFSNNGADHHPPHHHHHHQVCNNMGLPYGGYSKLKHEFPPGLVPSSSPSSSSPAASAASRPPWAFGSIPKSSSEFTTHHHHQHQQQQQEQFLKTSSSSSQRFHELQFASAAHPGGYDAQVSSLFKPSLGNSGPSSSAPPGSFGLGNSSMNYCKDRARQYPLQYNGGSLVLDHHRGELINLSKMTPQEILDAKALAASKSHSEAERRRRERINNHLNTLRGLLPSTTKTDKASLLAEVIEHVKDLKRQAAEIAEGGPVPTDVDELKVDADPSSSDNNFILKASLCCEDRPDLLTDLTKALRTLKLKTLKAEIATLGGRVKNVLLIGKDGNGDQSEQQPQQQQDRPAVISCVQDALRAVIDRSADLSASSYGSSKRQKMNSASGSGAGAGSGGGGATHHHESY